LCQFSAAAERIIDALIGFPVESCLVFVLEEIVESQILDYPKNLLGLLSLLRLRSHAQIMTDLYLPADKTT
jgi:hypothetical protein